jgi:hypothetical protein
MINQLIKVNDDLFLIKRITSEYYEQFASLWNEMSIKHKTFKKDGRMYFCECIEEAQIIEDNINQKQENND